MAVLGHLKTAQGLETSLLSTVSSITSTFLNRAAKHTTQRTEVMDRKINKIK